MSYRCRGPDKTLKFTPLEFETTVEIKVITANSKLKFTPLEFETASF